jgi:hypothetical protein
MSGKPVRRDEHHLEVDPMRAIKILAVSATITASLVVGVAGTSSAAPSPTRHPSTVWCC